MNKKIIFFISLLTACFLLVTISDSLAKEKGDRAQRKLEKTTDAVRYLIDVGNLWTVVSNYGWIGDDAFNNPSFEWPGGSGNHHLYQGSIWIAAKRQTSNGKILGKEECISITDALKAVTIDAAYLLNEDKIKGSIEPDKFADLVVLEKDPLSVEVDKVKDIKVIATMMGGKIFPVK